MTTINQFGATNLKSYICNLKSKIRMVYRGLGIFVSTTDITLAFAEFHESSGKWTYSLRNSENANAKKIHEQVNDFIEKNNLQFQVALITVFQESSDFKINGGIIAAATSLPVITDIDIIDKSLGGTGEFFKAMAEKLSIENAELTCVEKAICIALMGILRWREEYNFFSSFTSASRNSIGGAVWLGQEA